MHCHYNNIGYVTLSLLVCGKIIGSCEFKASFEKILIYDIYYNISLSITYRYIDIVSY